MIYAMVDLAQTDSDNIRYMPKWLWFFVIICFPALGALAWLFAGKWPDTSGNKASRPKAPDDDSDWLRSL